MRPPAMPMERSSHHRRPGPGSPAPGQLHHAVSGPRTVAPGCGSPSTKDSMTLEHGEVVPLDHGREHERAGRSSTSSTGRHRPVSRGRPPGASTAAGGRPPARRTDATRARTGASLGVGPVDGAPAQRVQPPRRRSTRSRSGRRSATSRSPQRRRSRTSARETSRPKKSPRPPPGTAAGPCTGCRRAGRRRSAASPQSTSVGRRGCRSASCSNTRSSRRRSSRDGSTPSSSARCRRKRSKARNASAWHPAT